ncbi:MAG: HEPN domain-containing protein [candidate division WOR-3 bacterium]|nr:HEPN domain-containing protein [candidate division WOR-3 bacterium]
MTDLLEKPPDEWLRQADYDMDTAGTMFRDGRYFYAVFMCHLSIEKTFKGLYVARFGAQPPRTHSLLYFVGKLGLELPDRMKELVSRLNGLSIPTRYPDDLRRMSAEFDSRRTEGILNESRKVLAWLKSELPKS